MSEFKDALKSFGKTQTDYREKANSLNEWKNQFQELETEVTNLMSVFEQKYEESVVDDDFSEDVKAKLENRRDGIRLSVKSASRLLRRLNPEKPLDTETDELITDEVMREKLMASEHQEASEEPEDAVQVEGVTENTVQVSELEEANEELNVEGEGEDIAPSDDEEVLVEAAEAEEEANTIMSEDQHQQTEPQEQSNVQQDQVIQTKISLLKEAIESNQHVLDQLDEHNQAAQKRFLTFIEKGVAPVLDGLFSGDKYGKELLAQLSSEDSADCEKVKKWLEIYQILMNEIKRLFDQFSIEYFSPEIGESFNELKHEPIGVVEDSAFQDEQIKEVVRYGLSFKKEEFDIRPAQVIVVKNKQVVEQRGNEDEV
ncbi:nucleotide exchange factor GrpE [Metabacillus litoralis]|uniref:nucleotide exchange factor GrpE n=1 Tax=Metabacillus litoralis TaxID=152268 RepID=UPI00203EDEFD|nr:nucleotide exchange factor GrpE [Metabacillus litoralis]MCM3162620.1 nucleotide exchange factor GrpE [Metabacillus litoralis]